MDLIAAYLVRDGEVYMIPSGSPGSEAAVDENAHGFGRGTTVVSEHACENAGGYKVLHSGRGA